MIIGVGASFVGPESKHWPCLVHHLFSRPPNTNGWSNTGAMRRHEARYNVMFARTNVMNPYTRYNSGQIN